MELYAAVRLAVVDEGLSHHEAGRRFGIDRRTVKKMLSYSAPPGYRRTKPVRRPKLDGFTGIVDAILEADTDPDVPRKQRHTAHRIFERLRDEHGFTGGYTIQTVSKRRRIARNVISAHWSKWLIPLLPVTPDVDRPSTFQARFSDRAGGCAGAFGLEEVGFECCQAGWRVGIRPRLRRIGGRAVAGARPAGIRRVVRRCRGSRRVAGACRCRAGCRKPLRCGVPSSIHLTATAVDPATGLLRFLPPAKRLQSWEARFLHHFGDGPLMQESSLAAGQLEPGRPFRKQVVVR